MFFTVIINQGANSYIQMEKKTIKVMKTIPVSYKKQLLVKVSIPLTLSFTSLLITLLVLVIGKVISPLTFIFSLLLVGLLLVIFEIVSLKEELSIRNHKPRSYFMSNLYSYALPFIYFAVTAVISYFGIDLIISYLIGLVVLIGIFIPNYIYIKRNMSRLFMELDVIN
jgi:4-hydroxybenzoate polyprenyltransferase